MAPEDEHAAVPVDGIAKVKGTEPLDHVVVLNVCEGAFPSTIPGDPLLALAMPRLEAFPDAEERRLFYVALTRARQSVLLVTRERQESGFVLELAREGRIAMRHPGRGDGPVEDCPECRLGVVVHRQRRSDGRSFLGCSRFPQCRWTGSWTGGEMPCVRAPHRWFEVDVRSVSHRPPQNARDLDRSPSPAWAPGHRSGSWVPIAELGAAGSGPWLP